jgi:hypothetical protein
VVAWIGRVSMAAARSNHTLSCARFVLSLQELSLSSKIACAYCASC